MEVIKPTEIPAIKNLLDSINDSLKKGIFKVLIGKQDQTVMTQVKTICEKEWDISSYYDDDDDTAMAPSGPLYWQFSVKK